MLYVNVGFVEKEVAVEENNRMGGDALDSSDFPSSWVLGDNLGDLDRRRFGGRRELAQYLLDRKEGGCIIRTADMSAGKTMQLRMRKDVSIRQLETYCNTSRKMKS
jgi:hypothetical protein